MEIGDKVICTTSISTSNGGPKKGERFIVLSISKDRSSIGFKLLRLDSNYDTDIKSGSSPNWGIGCFELVRTSWKITPRRNKNVA